MQPPHNNALNTHFKASSHTSSIIIPHKNTLQIAFPPLHLVNATENTQNAHKHKEYAILTPLHPQWYHHADERPGTTKSSVQTQ